MILIQAPHGERMATRLNGYLAQFAAVIGRELGVTEQEIASLDQEVADYDRRTRTGTLCAIDSGGVGPGVAAAFLAYVGDGKKILKPCSSG